MMPKLRKAFNDTFINRGLRLIHPVASLQVDKAVVGAVHNMVLECMEKAQSEDLDYCAFSKANK